MKSRVSPFPGVVLALGIFIFTGCSGSDNPPVVSSGPPAAAATDDQRSPQSDALTAAETAQINQADAEPVPTPRPDL